MAACWAGISAARTGAKVVLVDKGFVGTSGVTATAGPGHWWVSPEGNARSEAVKKRMALGCGLGEPTWMERIIDTTWASCPRFPPTIASTSRTMARLRTTHCEVPNTCECCASRARCRSDHPGSKPRARALAT